LDRRSVGTGPVVRGTEAVGRVPLCGRIPEFQEDT
jgi:hypothetical protein